MTTTSSIKQQQLLLPVLYIDHDVLLAGGHLLSCQSVEYWS